MGSGVSETILAIVTIAVIMLLIAWIILPFLVVGVNKRLDKLIKVQWRILKEMKPPEENDEDSISYTAEPDNKKENESAGGMDNTGLLLLIGLGSIALLYLIFAG